MNASNEQSSRPLKVTVVGDANVGKKSFLFTYTTKEFPGEYIPTVFDNYTENIKVDGKEYNISVWDTTGLEHYDKVRVITYVNTDCFLLCYSISSRSSFDNISTKWYPDIRLHCPNVPIVLVGTKMDLRDEKTHGTDVGVVSVENGRKLCKKIKAETVVECSAKNGENLTAVFESAVRAAIKKKSNP
ncbi:ras-like GTP-binding protein RhoL [Neocloeon triangulifer]|uniref:ras-like GTP-binding protein RhoL n=1 Tax=Neocloeon triangulifer TaxID=2078957 RepID=UPI00286F01F7|nr:ras-like GTP-binding protein RhoL [Neocloeon triangulifer]XP_059486485.1 ras-like GTP-binding protein RhoL [Neocloeon triangulifer]XP_059486487.1 ras-like GTP-binding protein RhoL [Neocloeon triangulifer]XP_059486488.1 ras-like GTP-binding protein RhoL [Neocloeon triangulifer]